LASSPDWDTGRLDSGRPTFEGLPVVCLHPFIELAGGSFWRAHRTPECASRTLIGSSATAADRIQNREAILVTRVPLRIHKRRARDERLGDKISNVEGFCTRGEALLQPLRNGLSSLSGLVRVKYLRNHPTSCPREAREQLLGATPSRCCRLQRLGESTSGCRSDRL